MEDMQTMMALMLSELHDIKSDMSEMKQNIKDLQSDIDQLKQQNVAIVEGQNNLQKSITDSLQEMQRKQRVMLDCLI